MNEHRRTKAIGGESGAEQATAAEEREGLDADAGYLSADALSGYSEDAKHGWVVVSDFDPFNPEAELPEPQKVMGRKSAD